VNSIAASSDGGGYWEFGADGRVYGFGDATYAGSAVRTSPIVAGASA
jgi:hypothetical protein